MKPVNEYIAMRTLHAMLYEQAAAGKLNTDNAPSSDPQSAFTPAEQKFLGKFDAYGSRHLGILYSLSDVGIREFMSRSGKDLNCTPEILLGLLRDKIIKIVPYTGFGRNNDYTIELQLSLDDVKGMGAEDKEAAETEPTAAPAPETPPAPSAEPTPAIPESPSETVLKYGDLLTESTLIAYKLMREKREPKYPNKTKVVVDDSRILKQIPKNYIKHVLSIIDMLSKKSYSVSEKQRLIADILDNIMVSFNLTPKQIKKSYDMHRDQQRYEKFHTNK